MHLPRQIEDTQSVLYLILNPIIDDDRRFRTKLRDIRDTFSFPIVNVPLECTNISTFY